MALLRLKKLYRAAGLPLDGAELPDHLAVMLAFAALAPPGHGEALLAEHRPAIELLRLSLHDLESPYAHVLDAVAACLPALERDRARRGRAAGARGPARGGGRARAVRPAGGDADGSSRDERRRDPALDHPALRRDRRPSSSGTGGATAPTSSAGRAGRRSSSSSKILGWAGPAFHYGALAAVGGHVIGLMIPKSFTDAVGMSEQHLPLVLGDRRRRRRRGLRRRVRRARLPAGHERPRPAHDLAHRPARLLPARRPDRARLLDDLRAQPDHRRRPTTTATSISHVVALAVHPAARRRGRPGRQHRLPGARDRRLGVLGAVPVQPPRARVEHPAAVPRPPLHPLPPPLRDDVQPSR